ncbi:MAG TPA: M1 family aminopeptidase, partial [Micromonosporaceae bacterium]
VTFADSSFIFRQVVTDAEREMRAYVILHEMAHMWFGDLVTMRWWNDIWLNEAFATYVGALAGAESSRFSNAWATFIGQFKSGAMAADQMPTTHPIVGEIVDLDAVQSAFDAITYRKGASVLRQLAAWVGSDSFAGGVHDYFAVHAWGNATATDFLDALATASGRDLGAWADEWLHRTGINTLSADFTVDADGVFTSFTVVQSGDPLRSHRIAIGSYGFDDTGALTRSGRIELDVVGARTEVPAMVGQPRPDLLLLNDDDLTYTKINLDDVSLATIVANAGAITDPLARALVWSIAWDMCRDARMPAIDYVGMVRSGVDRESLLTTRRTLIGQSVHAILRYADPDWISTGLAEVASHARSRLTDVPQTDDSRLIWLNALVEAARDSDDFDFLTALLDGSATVEGIEVGGDLRWRLIIALAAAGRLDAAGIDAQLANDNTTSGTEDAAEARAAIPTASAKAAAWKLIVDDAQPTPIRIYTAKGFAHEGQAELRSGYIDEYFELAPTFFAGSARLGRSLIALLYPRDEISAEALARTDAYLDRTDLDPSLRRMLVEGRDSVARALRAREAVAPTT